MTYFRIFFINSLLVALLHSQQLIAQSTFKMISPGGGGKIVTTAVKPDDSSVMIFGTDVGGVFRSLDGGQSYEKVSNGLTTKQIYDSHIALDAQLNTITFLGTSDGVYLSHDLGDTWVLKEVGFVAEPYSFTHPVYSIRTAPSNSNVVWATIGEAVTAEYRVNDSNTVYKSIDQGETWTSVLHIPISNDPAIGALTARVVIHPQDEQNVFIASNRGLYATYDGGNSWYELGKDVPYILSGGAWVQCTAALCNAEIMNRPRCTDPACLPLPITDYVGATHATLSDLDVHITSTGQTYLFATLDDFGHMDMTSGCGQEINDINLTRVSGGPYRSTDGGLTWTYLFQALPDPAGEVDHFLRCNDTLGRAWNGTYFNNIAVDPADSNHFFITATYLRAGVIEYYNGAWKHHSKVTMCGANSCFEGGTTQGLWANQAGPTVIDFDILNWNVSRPAFLFTHSRGVIHGQYNNLLSAYEFDHIDSNPDPLASGYWRGTGLTDYCALDMAIDTTGNKLFVAGQDSGVVLSEDAGVAWRLTDGGANNNDASSAIVRDETTGIVYATRSLDSKTDRHNVSYRNPVDGTWTTIGGYCGVGCTTLDNGLPNDLRVYDLALDYSTSAGIRGLFAGTEKGLYRYDPGATAGSQWNLVNAGGCPVVPASPVDARRFVRRVRTRMDYPGYVFFSTISADTNRIKNGVDPDSSAGIFVYRLDEPVPYCVNLNGSSVGREVRAPHDFVFATNQAGQDVLVAAGQFNWNPRVFQSPVNMTDLLSIDWDITADYGKLNALSGTELGDSATFNKKDFNLAVDPADPSRVLIGVEADPYFDHYAHTQVYISDNAGELNSFRVATELTGLPDKDIQFMQFSTSGDQLYIAPKCGGLYQIGNPFIDSDSDGVRDVVDNCPLGANPTQTDTDSDGEGDTCDSDDDNDGLTDSVEIAIGTDPLLSDTDNDSYSDGLEVSAGSDPLNSSSTPVFGDINNDGVVNTADFLIGVRILLNLYSPTPGQLARADVAPLVAGQPAPDGLFKLGDLLLIQRKTLGLVNF